MRAHSLSIVVLAQAIGVVLSHLVGGCARTGPEVGAAKPEPSPLVATAASSPSSSSQPSAASTPSVVVDTTPPAPAPCAKPTKPLSASECKAVLARAQKSRDAALAAVSKKCAADDECVPVQVRACLGSCSHVAIAKVSNAEFEKVTKAIDSTDCNAWYDGNCPATTPMPVPTCPMYVPTCAAGKCGARQAP